MGSGKGEIAKLLQKRGFNYLSLSDMVREEATKRGMEHTRENLQAIGNELRENGGAGALGSKARETIVNNITANWVIDGIRNPGEADALRELPDFNVIGVGANDEILINRIMDRNRDGGVMTREGILEKLNKEKGMNEPPEGQQVKKCLEDSDFFILNAHCAHIEAIDESFSLSWITIQSPAY